ncbi:tumor necrosis factor receptor superfamily member 6 [Neosynchiropus ocellatus]
MYVSGIVLCCLLTATSSLASGPGGDRECADGSYETDGKTCCLCAAGQRLMSHCTKTPADRKCDFCQPGQFNPHPNNEPNCRRCRSCSHHNENLEVDTSCTIARDATCRCQQDHFCRTKTEETCLLCHPCTECGSEGIKHPCTGSNNTVCNDKIEGKSYTPVIVAVVLVPVAVAVAFAIWCFLRKRRQPSGWDPVSQNPESTSPHEMEMAQIKNVDLGKHMPDIVEILGWSDMKEIATRSRLPQTTIDFCFENHRGNAREQTHELLQEWVENMGKAASQHLIQTLEKMNRKAKVQKIKVLLSGQD